MKIMSMRRLSIVPFLVLTGCPKDKVVCRELQIPVTTGDRTEVFRDACPAGDDGSWWSLAPALFKIQTLPWYLEYTFRELDRHQPILVVRAAPYAPLGTFETEYEYDLSLLSDDNRAPPRKGRVLIAVHAPWMQDRVNFTAQIVGEGAVQNHFLSCGLGNDRCAVSVAVDEQLSINTIPADGYQFYRVEGCSLASDGTGPLVGTAGREMTCTFVFAPTNGDMLLNVGVEGTGQVRLAADQVSETITQQQSFQFKPGTQVSLTAIDVGGFEWQRWTGDCAKLGREAQVTLNAHKSCTAVFAPRTIEDHALNVEIIGQGSVRIGDQAPCGIETGCRPYAARENEVVMLEAVPSPGWNFMGWGGACSGTQPTTSVTVNGNVTCNATFEVRNCATAQPPTLGRIVVLDNMGVELGSSLDPACSIQVPRSFNLKAEGFSPNVGSSLWFEWDTSYEGPGDAVTVDAQGEMISMTVTQSQCRGIHLTARDECGLTATTNIAVRVN